MIHLDISVPMLLFWSAVFFLAAMGAVLLCLSLAAPVFMRWLEFRYMGRAERIAEYEAACAQPAQLHPVAPAPQVQVVEYIPPRRVEEPLLPPAPVTLDEAPIFAEVPFTYPASMPDFGFNFWGPSWSTQTGEFPVLEVEAAAEPKARDRFATKQPRRRKTVKAMPEAPAQLIEAAS